MKILFITANDVNDINGGARASQRNLECLQDIYGKSNVEICYVPPITGNKGCWKHVKSVLLKLFSTRVYPSLESFGLNTFKYDLFFFDSSRFGSQIRKLKKKRKVKIVSFFHNCEIDYITLFLNKKPTIGNRLYIRRIRKSEELTLEYSDACVFINDRDMNRIVEIYGITPKKSEVITMTMKDAYREIPTDQKSPKPIYTILGSYFKPNKEGIIWFVKNVLPHVDITLRVVGKNMHLLRNDIDCSEIEVYSNVPDLTRYMAESDYMLYPIFEGSGMKIKTCEALMWGKNILGTPEAFSGYGIKDFTMIGACCETAEEFISAINNLKMPRFNSVSRLYYLEKFSFEKSVSLYKSLLKDL